MCTIWPLCEMSLFIWMKFKLSQLYPGRAIRVLSPHFLPSFPHFLPLSPQSYCIHISCECWLTVEKEAVHLSALAHSWWSDESCTHWALSPWEFFMIKVITVGSGGLLRVSSCCLFPLIVMEHNLQSSEIRHAQMCKDEFMLLTYYRH